MRIALILALACSASPALAQNAPGKRVITAARMIDVLTGKVIEHPAIFVGEGWPHHRHRRCAHRANGAAT
jgi:hypothetical protein